MNKLSPHMATGPSKPPPLPPNLLAVMLASSPRRRKSWGGLGSPSPRPALCDRILRFFLIAGLAIGGFASCTNAAPDSASLSLSFGSAARAFAPTTASVARYVLSATGPGGLTSTTESDKTSLTLELAPGEWTIVAEGKTSEGKKLVAGSLVVKLEAGERRSATIVLLPEGGFGSLLLSWSTLGDTGANCGIEGSLRPIAGESLPLSGQGILGSCSLADIPAGSWTLELRLVGPAGNLAGLADSILIVPGCETKAAVVFEPPRGRLALSLVGPRFEAKTLCISPPLRRISQGGTATFAVPVEAGPGAWYREGLPIGETGRFANFLAMTEQRERIDWVSTASFSALSGSAALIPSPAQSFGPFDWRETLVRLDLAAESASKALDGCRDLAFSPDGSQLLLSGKDGMALGSILIKDNRSPFLDGALTTADIAELDAPTRLSVRGSRLLLLAEGSGTLLSFAREVSGVPTFSGSCFAPEFLTGRALALAPDGAFAYVASETGDGILKVAIGADGFLGAPSFAAKALDPGCELLDRPLSLALSPDGNLLALGTAGDDAVYLFNRGAATGQLTLFQRLPKEAFLPLASLSDAVDLAFSPTGGSLFVLSYYGRSLVRLDRDAGGTYKPIIAAKSGTLGLSGFDYPKRLAINPSGTLLVVSGGGTNDGLAVFTIAGQGQLSFVSSLLPDGSDGRLAKPGPLAFSPDGQVLAVASPDEDRLAFYTLRSEP